MNGSFLRDYKLRMLYSAVLAGLVACTDRSPPTRPSAAPANARGMGTPIAATVGSSAARFSIAPEATAPTRGPTVGVLAYCTDLTGIFGAQNVANTLLADGRFGSVTVVDADASLPTAQDLLSGYAVVVAMTDNRCGEPIPQAIADAAADALTGFVQGGGGAVLTTFGFADRASGGIGFGASIFGPGLSPLVPVLPGGNAPAGSIDVAGASTAEACHALLDGVTSPLSSVFANNVALSGGATLCASYTNERALLAINAARNIVGLNSFPADESDNTQASYRRLVSNAVFAIANVTRTVQVVPAGEAATVTVAEGGQAVAALDFPAGTFPVAVIVKAKLSKPTLASPCHDFLIGQVGRCLELTARDAAGVKQLLTKPATVGLCLDMERPLELYKFESAQDRAVPHEQIAVPFLDCDGFQLATAASKNWLEGLALGVTKRVGQWLRPQPLYAAHGGFGGRLPVDELGLSFFTWAPPVQVSAGVLVANALRSGKDVYTVQGKFRWTPKGFEPFPLETGFDPSTQDVTVGFGASVYTIPANSFHFSDDLKAWYYAKATATGVTAMVIKKVDGSFTIAATVPTAGALPASPNMTPRAFTLQIGHRTQGALLKCDATRRCVPQELMP